MNEKECYACKIIKDISLFKKNKKCLSGYEGLCKECAKKKTNEWKKTAKGKEYQKEYMQKFREKNAKPKKERIKKDPLIARENKLKYAREYWHKNKVHLISLKTCKILKAHAEALKEDEERLSTDFLKEIIGVKCND